MAPHDNGEDVRGQPCSWTLEESEVESYEHQDNANIHCQPFPESVSEEREIYTDYDGYHRLAREQIRQLRNIHQPGG